MTFPLSSSESDSAAAAFLPLAGAALLGAREEDRDGAKLSCDCVGGGAFLAGTFRVAGAFLAGAFFFGASSDSEPSESSLN